MLYQINNWSDISREYSDSILLGNGASISIDRSFTYSSLKQHAIENGLLTEQVQRLFRYFRTEDFELILRLVWQANKVNLVLDIADQQTRVAYEHVRDCLIRAVRSIHPEYFEVEQQLPYIANFLSRFKMVFSLNYDLTLYWVVMYSNRIFNGHTFKDCIIHGKFNSNWRYFRDSISQSNRYTTLIFYPHGSLVLARDVLEQEIKLETREGSDLLKSILYHWQSSNYIPLFVSEGTSQQKIASIQNSHYLNTVYREIIPQIYNNLTIFGWGFGEHDIHILKRIKESRVKKIAVSVKDSDQAYCSRVTKMIYDNVSRHINVVFFDCESDGCWNHPLRYF